LIQPARTVGIIYSRLTNPNRAVSAGNVSPRSRRLVGAVCCSSGHAAQHSWRCSPLIGRRDAILWLDHGSNGGTVHAVSPDKSNASAASAKFVDFAIWHRSKALRLDTIPVRFFCESIPIGAISTDLTRSAQIRMPQALPPDRRQHLGHGPICAAPSEHGATLPGRCIRPRINLTGNGTVTAGRSP